MNDTEVTTAPPVIRAMRPGEARDVRRLFYTTLLLGRPLPIENAALYDYESLCLDWYLTNGTVRVVEHDGRVRGYLLACLDQERYEQWARPRAVRWGARALWRLATGQLRGDARRFTQLRLRDGIDTWRGAPPSPYPAHAHFNLDPSMRGLFVGRQVVATMDELVAGAGLDGWYGEMNVPKGRSLSAVGLAGAEVVHRQVSHTFSAFLGRTVERLTIVRPLEARTDTLAIRTIGTGAPVDGSTPAPPAAATGSIPPASRTIPPTTRTIPPTTPARGQQWGVPA